MRACSLYSGGLGGLYGLAVSFCTLRAPYFGLCSKQLGASGAALPRIILRGDMRAAVRGKH